MKDEGIIENVDGKPVIRYTNTLVSEKAITKMCAKCCKTKSVHEFTKDSSSPDKKSRYCKDCTNKAARERWNVKNSLSERQTPTLKSSTISRMLHSDKSDRIQELEKEVELLKEIIRLRKEVGE